MSPSPLAAPRGSSSSTRFARGLRALLAAVAIIGGLLAPSTAGAAAVLPPDRDPFYIAPADLASVAPGGTIRSRPVRIQVSPGLYMPNTAYQVLYRTNDSLDAPVAAVATILLPQGGDPTDRKLVSYQTAYDAVGTGCEPSYSLQSGSVGLQSAEMLLMTSLLGRGYVVVTADYEGPTNAFMAGRMAGHGVLDGIRAAEGFAPAGLSSTTKVGMMGYSGGGQSTAWANEMAPTYAPELNIVGASQGGIAPLLGRTLRAMDGQLYAGVVFAAVVGLVNGYPEVGVGFEATLNERGKAAFRFLRKKAQCITNYVVAFPFAKLKNYIRNGADPLKDPKFKAIADANSLGQGAPTAPTLMFQSVWDEMGSYPDVFNLAKKYCKAGTPLTLLPIWDQEHGFTAVTTPPMVLDWIAARFRGAPIRNTCRTLGR